MSKPLGYNFIHQGLNYIPSNVTRATTHLILIGPDSREIVLPHLMDSKAINRKLHPSFNQAPVYFTHLGFGSKGQTFKV